MDELARKIAKTFYGYYVERGLLDIVVGGYYPPIKKSTFRDLLERNGLDGDLEGLWEKELVYILDDDNGGWVYPSWDVKTIIRRWICLG